MFDQHRADEFVLRLVGAKGFDKTTQRAVNRAATSNVRTGRAGPADDVDYQIPNNMTAKTPAVRQPADRTKLMRNQRALRNSATENVRTGQYGPADAPDARLPS